MDLIGTVSSALGIQPSAAEGAVGSVFKLFQEQAPPDAFGAVKDKVPEASGWMQAAPSAEGAGGGSGLGGLLGMAGGALGSLGGSAGALAGPLGGLVSSLSKSGLGADALPKLLPLVLQFLKGRVGDGVLGKLVASVPGLAQLGGGGDAGAEGKGGSVLGSLGGLFK